jgi:transcriptional regulator with XRE-family HTH domain
VTVPALEQADVEALTLGAEIRRIRLARKMTLAQLADGVGVSQSLVSQVERGRASPSITTLRKVAEALDIPVAALFVQSDGGSSVAVDNETRDRSGRQVVVRHDRRKSLRLPGSHVAYELLTPDLNRQIEFLWIDYDPWTVSASEFMAHIGEENALCLHGTVVIVIDGQDFVLSEGDSISFDSSRPHRVENRTDLPATLVTAITPPAF